MNWFCVIGIIMLESLGYFLRRDGEKTKQLSMTMEVPLTGILAGEERQKEYACGEYIQMVGTFLIRTSLLCALLLLL